MLGKKAAKLINEQVTLEFYSAYLYLDFANYYAGQGLDGFAHWFEIQAQEERDHAMLMRTYLLNNDVSVVFGTIDKPDKKYKKILDPLEAALEHEQFITGCINKIYSAADEEKDYRTMQCFDWFVKEQGEEEKNVSDLIKKFKLFGNDPKGLYALNQELLTRVYTAPSLVL
jgi:ferritin